MNEPPNYTVPLPRFVRYCLSKNFLECVEIDEVDAYSIKMLPNWNEYCHIQFESFDGIKLKQPILWNLASYKSSYLKWSLDKERSAKERLSANILTENRTKVLRSISARTGISIEMLSQLAHTLAKDKNTEAAKILGVNLDLTEVK